MMQHYRSLEQVQLAGCWLTIGVFDGVHLGHQAILRQLTAGAHAVGLPAVVLTFYPHPAAVLGKRQGPLYLSGPEEKAGWLGQAGVDMVITQPFNLEIAHTSADVFMDQVCQRLHPNQVWVGPDFALGRDRQGNQAVLAQLGERYGYTLGTIASLRIGNETVSSSLIRSALAAGNVEKAASLLGRPYEVVAGIIHGDGRGRPLGFPTANLDIAAERIIPACGVYACQVTLEGRSWPSVTNVGVRPTFENQPVVPRVETHLLDFDADLYGQVIHLAFITRLRAEVRFADIAALIQQVQTDIQRTRVLLTP